MKNKMIGAALAVLLLTNGAAHADEPTPDQKAFFNRWLTAAVAAQECGFALNKEVVEAAAAKSACPAKTIRALPHIISRRRRSTHNNFVTT